MIVNWNAQADRQTSSRATAIKSLLDCLDADVICLTEGYPANLPDGGHIITSELSNWRMESKGARKGLMWTRTIWLDVDTIGSTRLPEGRFMAATTHINAQPVRFYGVCVPYQHYRTQERWQEQRKKAWQGAEEYLVALREDILSQISQDQPCVILGDYNLQIPPGGYPGHHSQVNREREMTFSGWNIITAGKLEHAGLDRKFIDHVALSKHFSVFDMQFIQRTTKNGLEISDHNGVRIKIRLK